MTRTQMIDFLKEVNDIMDHPISDAGVIYFVDHHISSHPEGDGLQIATEALTEIAKGQGRYDMDRLRHAANCIEDMQKLAKDALSKLSPPKEQTK